MIWKFVPAETELVDSEYRLLVNGQDVGVTVQDARSYGGIFVVNQEHGEGDEFAISHHGEYRTLRMAKAVGGRVFRIGY